MFRVADVLRPEVGRSWHEAVAIVQEVALQLVPGAAVPGADELLLDGDGTLQLGFGSDTAQHPVTALGSLLATLLDGIEAPGGLRELARSNATATPPSNTTVASFQRALAFYERPARDNDLRAVAARLRAAPPDARAEFERLRVKIGAREDQPAPPEQNSKRRVSRRTIIVAAVVELALLVGLIAYARPHYFRSVSALGEGLEQRLADTISGGLDSAGTTVVPAAATPEGSGSGPAEAPDFSIAAGSASTVPAGGAVPAAARSGAQSPRGRIRGSSPPSAGAVHAPATAAAMVGPAPPPIDFVADANGSLIVEPVPAFEARAAGSYSTADTDVDPPRLSRPQLPRQPRPGSDTGYFDLIVNELGDVEQVTLVSPMRRFQERMLVAAAKAWKFMPAMRNGQPVRYRMRVAIILPAQP